MVVTCFTVWCTELQAVYPSDVLHEVFFRNTPAGTEWPEVTPTVVLREAWRTVVAVRSWEIVLVSIVVVQTTEVTFLLVFVCLRFHWCDRHEVAEFVDTMYDFTQFLTIRVFILVRVVFMTQHHVNSVLTEILVVRNQLVQGLCSGTAVSLALTTRTCSTVTYPWIFINGTTEVVVVIWIVCCQCQTFDRNECHVSSSILVVTCIVTVVEFCFSQSVTTGIGNTLTIVVIDIQRRIGSRITCSIYISTGFQVVGMNRIDRSHTTDKTSQVVIWAWAAWCRSRVVRNYASQCQVQTGLEPLGRINVVVQTARVTFEVGLHHVTLIIQVWYRSVSVALVSLGSIAEVVFLTVTSAECSIFPIQVITPLQVVHAGRWIQLTVCTYDLVIGDTLEWVINQLVTDLRTGQLSSFSSRLAGSDVRVLHHFPLHWVVVHQTYSCIVLVCTVRETLVDSQVEVSTTIAFTFLGSNQNYTVTGWRTVQRSRSSVLQDSHRFDVGRVDITNITVVNSTVHYIKRSRRSVYRTETTDTDRSSFTRLTGCGSYLNTGSVTFESRSNVGDSTLFDGLCTYGRGRTGEGRLLGSTVSYDYHFVDYLCVRIHYNLLRGRSSDRHFNSTHTYKRYLQRFAACRNVVDFILTVNVCNGTDGCPLYQYRCTDNRLVSFSIDYHTGNLCYLSHSQSYGHA